MITHSLLLLQATHRLEQLRHRSSRKGSATKIERANRARDLHVLRPLFYDELRSMVSPSHHRCPLRKPREYFPP